ncbi:MAG: hypothetical protein R6U92_03250, partial [Bacillota bacterium]
MKIGRGHREVITGSARRVWQAGLVGCLALFIVFTVGGVVEAATTYITGEPESGWVGGDDYTNGPLGIGFSFPFYPFDEDNQPNQWDEFYVTTNGVVSFGGGNRHFSNVALPAGRSYNHPAAFPFWDDLHPEPFSGSTDGFVLYKTIAQDEYDNPYEEDLLIVQWTNYGYFSSALVHGTFQVHLVADGRIVFNYNDLVSPERSYGQSATIGIQESGSGPAVQVSYNDDAGIRSGTAIVFELEDEAYTYSGPDASGFWDVLLIEGDTPPPTKPTGPDPATGETASVTPTLAWSASTGADDYTVLVSLEEDLTNTVIDTTTTETSLEVLDELEVEETYYWQVIARNESGDAPSDRWDFLTADIVETYTVRYLADENGIIEGEAIQDVEAGADASTVRAVANSGYRFDGWSDGVTTAERT